MVGSEFQSLTAAGSSQNRIAKAFEECPFAFQHIFVIVNAEHHCASHPRMCFSSHGLPSEAYSGISEFPETVQNCSTVLFSRHGSRITPNSQLTAVCPTLELIRAIAQTGGAGMRAGESERGVARHFPAFK